MAERGSLESLFPDRKATARALREEQAQPSFTDNLRTSASSYVADLTRLFTDPKGTLLGVKDIGMGLLEKTGLLEDRDHAKYADAVGRYLVARYGGWENLKKTAYDDPVGLAADVSMIMTGGGGLASRAPALAGKLADAASVAGRVANPIASVPARVAGLGVEAAGKRVTPRAGAVAGGIAGAALGGKAGHVLGAPFVGETVGAIKGAQLGARAAPAVSSAMQKAGSLIGGDPGLLAAGGGAQAGRASEAARRPSLESLFPDLKKPSNGAGPTKVTIYKGQPGAGAAPGEPKAVKTERIAPVQKPPAQPKYQGLE